MKKKLSLLLLICILSALNINAEIYNGICGENVNYSLNTETGLLSITGTGAMEDYTCTYDDGDIEDCSVPWYGKRSYITTVEIANGVTSIGNNAFANCPQFTITIPNSVTSIGRYAFQKSGITSIAIPNSVTEIKDGTFDGCNGLVSIEIPNSVTSIGGSAFQESGITSIEIPNSVTYIGNYAFDGCTRLKSVTLGDNVEEIGAYAFRYCVMSSITIPDGVNVIQHHTFYRSALKSVTLGKGVTNIADYAFAECMSLKEICCFAENVPNTNSRSFDYVSGVTLYVPEASVDAYRTAWGFCSTVLISSGPCGANVNYYLDTSTGLLSITGTGAMTDYSNEEDVPWYSNRLSITAVKISDGVASIGNVAFEDCSSLTSVTIGNSVRSIGDWAFGFCSSLTSVTIPNSVTSIGYKAFYYCSGLTSVTIGNSVTSIEACAFQLCSGLTSVTIPNSVTSIGELAFGSCTSLTSVIIPNSMTSIGERVFADCSGLTSITIPNSVTSIGNLAFYYCTGLTSVTIPNSVTRIRESAFEYCSGLTSVTIGNSVTSIGNYAFRNCTGLTSVISEIEEPFAFGSKAFGNISSSCTLTVPYGTRDAYIARGWTTDVFKGGIVEMDPDAMNINMSANEIGTYCCDYDLDFSGVSGLKAYIMSGFSPSTSTLVLTPVTMVPAGTGLLLRGAEGNYEVPCTTTDMYYTNLLKGVTTATAIDPTDGEYTNFILSNGAHGIGFYTLSESGELAANKAYLQLPTASVASLSRAMRLVFADDITGIDEKKAETKKEDNIFYDLQGRRVDNPTQGLYIVNGKKIFINK